MKRIIQSLTQVVFSAALIFISSCTVSEKKEITSTPQSKAEESILSWMDYNKEEYPKYKPLGFGEVTARFERTDRTIQLNDLIEVEKAKPNASQQKLDSLKDLLAKNKGLFLGYIIKHKYETTSIAGEVFKDEKLFFLDTSFRVLTILNPDAFDMILDEKLIFRPDSVKK